MTTTDIYINERLDCMHNGLNRTSIGEQGHHDDNDLHRLT